MSKQVKKGLIPAFRFPEFRNAGEWKKKPLANYIDEYSERTSSNTELEVYSSTREGLKPQSEYYDGRNLTNDGEYGVVPTEHFVYRHMSDDDVFKFNLNQLEKNIAVSKEYPVFKAVGLDSRFLLNILNEGQEFKRFAISQKKGGTRTRLYLNTLRTFEFFLPDFEEQQKIADCLISIDELITIQSKKLDLLKAHKKGLVRQLFPAEGQTVPNYRFPEFQEKGEWIISTIGDISEMASGGTPSRSMPEYWNGDIPWASTTLINFNTIEKVNEYITEDGLNNSSTKIFPKGTILMAMYGQGVTRGKVAMLGMNAAINQACAAIQLNEKMNKEFVFQNLAARYDEIRKISNPGGQENLSAALIKKISFSYPQIESGEQQKIADCLSSIDELIAAQTRKLVALKTHKKGLIQQLFPAIDEVIA